MKFFFSVFLVLQLHGTISSLNIHITEKDIIAKNNINVTKNYMDVLMEDLLNQPWEKEESTCLNKIINIMSNVKNSTLWAVWIWDSMQTPAGLLYGSQYDLGNFDQCMNSPWMETHPEFRTQYCLADIKLSETDADNGIGDPYKSVKYHTSTMTKHWLQFNKITWGVCIPAECNTKSTIKFVRSMLKYTHLGPEIKIIDVDQCQVAGTTAEFSWGTYFFLFLITSVAIITISCTIINRIQATSTDTFESKILKAFCLTTNVSSLNKLSKNDINVLHGLKAFNSFMVVATHVFFIQCLIGFGNSLTLDSDMDGLKSKTFRMVEYTVDISFMISGLLRIKSYISFGKIVPYKAILKRYLRYIVTIGVIILSITTLHKHIGDGPIWNQIAVEESKACKKNWLISLLMLGNYVDNENICYPVLWTVPCDFHLSVIATMLYWIFQKNKKAAITIYVILTTTALILPGVLNYQQNLPNFLVSDFRLYYNYKKVIADNYILSHHRSAPYFIGMALGFFMSTYNPNRHRNMFSKLTSLLGTIFALTILALNIMGRNALDQPNSNALFSFIFSSLHRSIFTFAICCIIVVCEYGTIPVLGSVLTWPAFIPISKLSYGIYLVHCLIYSRMIATTRSTLHYDALLVIIYSIALMTISCAVSMLLYLFVEAPANRITDIMINVKADGEKKQANETTTETKNGIPHSNGMKKNI